MSLRVAILTDNDFSKVTGVTTTLRAVVAHAPADIVPRVYACERREVDTAGYRAFRAPSVGIPYYRHMAMYLPPMGRLRAQLDADGVDLLHYTTPGPMGLAAIRLSRSLPRSMVGSYHTDLAEYTRVLSGRQWLGDLFGRYMRWSYRHCSHVLVPSAATRHLATASGIDPARVGVWVRGVSTTQFTPARRDQALRDAWRVPDGGIAVLYAGRLSVEKGLDMVPALATRLRVLGIPHRFVFVGAGPMDATLAARCPGAVFLGALAHDDVAVAMASADVFLFPSRTDTAGNVVLEAQASGLPVLVTPDGGPRENMQDDVTGVICAEVGQFAGALAGFVRTPARRQAMAAAARAYAMTRSWSSALAPLYATYREAAASIPRAGHA